MCHDSAKKGLKVQYVGIGHLSNLYWKQVEGIISFMYPPTVAPFD